MTIQGQHGPRKLASHCAYQSEFKHWLNGFNAYCLLNALQVTVYECQEGGKVKLLQAYSDPSVSFYSSQMFYLDYSLCLCLVCTSIHELFVF